MASLEIGTSTSNSSGGKYEVFLSFRGSDTRRTFTNSLHHALLHARINVFIDKEELRVGERIGDNLIQAIDNSKLYIPIFSKNYASSHWCLDELVKMVENTSNSKEDGKCILPIFLDVTTDDVKLKTELYKKHISNLEQQMEGQKNKFSSKDIEKWQQALKHVCCIKGWELEEYEGYTELIQAVVDQVVVMLNRREIKVTEDLVGMDDQVAEVKKLLDIDSDEVRLVGIYGMSGIGKTTLAKIIFNHLYDRFGRNCSFLHVAEDIEKTKGLVELRKKLLSDMSYHTVASKIADNDTSGTDMLEDIIRSKKMLIVLDNVHEAKQIETLIGETELYAGTRILVTTKDKKVLTIRKFKYKIEKYEMVPLSEVDALELFSRHAFNDKYPPDEYFTLSRKIVSIADGLPLAVEVIGSLLFGENDIDIWKGRLKQLKKTSHKGILGRLRISYDTLDCNEQQIFLDIACFFVGENKTDPMYVWENCDLIPKLAIEVLIRRCMIKVSDDGKFGMHDLFRDLGKAIAKEKHTSLLEQDDFIDELRSTEDKRSVRALRLKSGAWPEPPIIATPEQIKQFPCIRFLWLSEVICQGDFTGCLSELRWINLDYRYAIPPGSDLGGDQRFEATNSLHLANVVVVNLAGVDITEDVFKSLIKEARKLKVLTLL